MVIRDTKEIVMKSFWERLNEGVIVADGAMGTTLYANGIPKGHCYDELNISRPEAVLTVHRSFVEAGAEILETNTFGANHVILERYYDLGHMVREINMRGAELAREAAEGSIYVAGSVGPVMRPFEYFKRYSSMELHDIFSEQISALIEGGIDLIILETMADLDELKEALAVARELSDLPVICQMSFLSDDKDRTLKSLVGADPETAARELVACGARIIGANCGQGPQDSLKALLSMARATSPDIFLSVQPNAGLPTFVDGRFTYPSSPEYFAEYAGEFVKAGASIIGGCCGTTPEHIRAMVKATVGMHPTRQAQLEVEQPSEEQAPAVVIRGETLRERLREKFVITVEMDPPRGVGLAEELEMARRMKEKGVDGVNVSDSPMARVRMNPLPLCHMITEELGMDVILHFTCRDRNLLALQSDLLGAYTLGIRNVLALTGDPPSVGDYPYATAVFEVDSKGLLEIMRTLNNGSDLAGNPLGQAPGFCMGVACNPASDNVDREIERLLEKVEAGAHFIQTQPIYDIVLLEHFLKRAAGIRVPFIVSLLPLYNIRHAEFLHNEVPGIIIPEKIRDRMRRVGKAEGPREGVAVARELVKEIRQLANGICLMPPFRKYEMAIQIIEP
jgi:methionine synthase I (cobalamin-dependent)/5,10-methylenetetrahydrofolate reductase